VDGQVHAFPVIDDGCLAAVGRHRQERIREARPGQRARHAGVWRRRRRALRAHGRQPCARLRQRFGLVGIVADDLLVHLARVGLAQLVVALRDLQQRACRHLSILTMAAHDPLVLFNCRAEVAANELAVHGRFQLLVR
jgi:hypothetical protein